VGYPFGKRIEGLSVTGVDPQPAPPLGGDPRYKYNGKELDEEKGLDWLAYGARYYDPEIGRWHVVDPAGEFYVGYIYIMNSPIVDQDKDGKNGGKFESLYLAKRVLNSSNMEREINMISEGDRVVAPYVIGAGTLFFLGVAVYAYAPAIYVAGMSTYNWASTVTISTAGYLQSYYAANTIGVNSALITGYTSGLGTYLSNPNADFFDVSQSFALGFSLSVPSIGFNATPFAEKLPIIASSIYGSVASAASQFATYGEVDARTMVFSGIVSGGLKGITTKGFYSSHREMRLSESSGTPVPVLQTRATYTVISKSFYNWVYSMIGVPKSEDPE
jgi:RHS repeat-associated protein